ncbi:MAG: tetratricopeptide repeat protein [Syntrophobacterales bacterium]|nr:MAG: tetratricopeptide repeat protein [Syntrophobacterales bacterium]
MKISRRIGVSVLMILFLAVGLCFGQDTAKQRRDKGLEYAAQGKFKEAKEQFDKALKVDPHFESATKCLKVINDVNKGKIKSKTAIHIFKGEIAYWVNRRWVEAIAEYNKAIQINPRYAVPYGYRGDLYLLQGLYDEAISDCSKAIEVDPRYVSAYNTRGVAYYSKGQYDQAIADLNKAIEIEPRNAMPYSNRGLVMMELGNIKTACSDWKRACELGDCRSYTTAKKLGYCK